MPSLSSRQTEFELSIVLADGSTVVGAVAGGEEWLSELAERPFEIRRDTTWTTVGHAQPTFVPIDVEGHLIVLRLPTAADADALRRALAIGALTATLTATGIVGLKASPSAAPDAQIGQPAVLDIGSADARTHPVINTASSVMQLPVPIRLGTTGIISGAPDTRNVPGRAELGGTSAASAATIGALPAPYYDDIITPHHEYEDWDVSLLDTIYRLPAEYAPQHLVSVGEAGLNGSGKVRDFVIDDLRALASAARAAGAPIAIASAYRSHQQQARLFQGYVDHDGYDQAIRESARPGHSEHQLGTAIDFKSPGGPAPWSLNDWAETPAGAWMRDHAWQYGFIMSYPAEATAVTGYMYESWHYRYVGRETATSIHHSGLTTREWLWQHGAGNAPAEPADDSSS